jgi:hypothetical protein
VNREQWIEVLKVLAERALGADEVHRALITILNSDAERLQRALREKTVIWSWGGKVVRID